MAAAKVIALGVQETLTDVIESIGRFELLDSKNLIEEPLLTTGRDALNDIDAILNANLGKASGSLLDTLGVKRQILEDCLI